jgi:nucleoside phosphorylase
MRFAVVTGLALEAGRLGGRDREGAAVYRIACGAGAAAAGVAAGLVADGAPALLSLGLCGALVPALGTGEVVLASAVVTSSGARYPCEPRWLECLGAAVGLARPGVVLGAEQVVASPAEKCALAAATGAVAVDTESHHVAVAAAAAGLPFAALRVVVDEAGDTVPPAALAAYGGNGRLRLLALAGALLRHPGELPALLRLAGRSWQALSRLGGVGRLGVRLGPPL